MYDDVVLNEANSYSYPGVFAIPTKKTNSFLILQGDYDPAQGVTTEVLRVRLEYKKEGSPAWNEANSMARNGNEWVFNMYPPFSPLMPESTDLRLIWIKDSNGKVIWER